MDDKDFVRLSGVAYESLVNGPGIRRVLFSQGCLHDCKSCFNINTHSFDGGKLENMDELIEDIRKNPMIKGVTFSGGDPLEQADKFAYIAEKIKAMGLNTWCYTGYTFEYVLKSKYERRGWEALLKYIDVMVDGKFDEDKKNERLKYRGSSNQRIIDVQESINTESVKILNYDE
ncbi:MAG: anaerobic ribonucleoside-triphosphate reductase activating protein [Clostridiaceae bacterium]|nr:anaerobic ribonucleoside-triphosphate reductase activating protein [Clostridiaceae bacterium]